MIFHLRVFGEPFGTDASLGVVRRSRDDPEVGLRALAVPGRQVGRA